MNWDLGSRVLGFRVLGFELRIYRLESGLVGVPGPGLFATIPVLISI